MGKEPAQDRPQADRDRDEPVSIPLDPEAALRGLLKVAPESEPAPDDATNDPDGGQSSQRRPSES